MLFFLLAQGIVPLQRFFSTPVKAPRIMDRKAGTLAKFHRRLSPNTEFSGKQDHADGLKLPSQLNRWYLGSCLL